MRILPLGCALLLLASAGTAAGSDVNVDCDVHSDYDFALTSRSLILTREDGAPKTVLMRQGRLFIDDRWVEVGAADRQRLSDYEREARAMMPLAAKIGQDAADIAFTALGAVAKGFSLDQDATDAKLAPRSEERRVGKECVRQCR